MVSHTCRPSAVAAPHCASRIDSRDARASALASWPGRNLLTVPPASRGASLCCTAATDALDIVAAADTAAAVTGAVAGAAPDTVAAACGPALCQCLIRVHQCKSLKSPIARFATGRLPGTVKEPSSCLTGTTQPAF